VLRQAVRGTVIGNDATGRARLFTAGLKAL
jgi:hypothetical protein